ncbi:type II secretion system protein [Lactobacillus sp.]|uniref:type II secretion system protein n=1 Tax=Lactobacillus sp. TaxID=1591 RepID=UPI0019AB909B|nr:type II secretion system protein [Lactobacillus sp.]MBD5430410.1 type II secretion system protein [Lactobacillus sp.]
MIKQQAFLLVEASISLVLACLGVTLLFYTLGQTKRIDYNIERRVDRAYAWRIFNETKHQKIIVHDHVYERAPGTKVMDKTLGKIYEVK